MKVLCVLNPEAADGLAMQRWPLVAALLPSFGLDHELFALREKPFVESICQRLVASKTDFDVVAGIGGDGTHSAVINALMAFRARQPQRPLPPYAFIPLGTGNDIAKSLGIRIRDEFTMRDLRRAVATIAHGSDYHMDLGVIGDRYFADALTVGLDSRILRERNRQKRRIESIPILRQLVRGRFLYTLATGRPLLEQQPVPAEIQVDGRLWYSGPMLNVVINNTRIYAGAFDFSDQTFANDGRLDLVLFTGHKDYLTKYLLAIRNSPAKVWRLSERLSQMASQVQGTEFQIRVNRPEPAQVDGEELEERDTFEVSVVPHAVPIKVPAEPI